MLLIGPAGAGKTRLFYRLVTGDNSVQTISSVEPNTSHQVKVRVGGEDQIKQIEIIDVPGHYNYRQKLRESYLPQAAAIVLVIDAKDK